MLQPMQNTIDTNFKDVKERLADLEDRMVGVEEKQKLTNQPGTPTSSSCESPSEFGLKCRIPPELQVTWYTCVSCNDASCFFHVVRDTEDSLRSQHGEPVSS